jgi:hypothetical protein
MHFTEIEKKILLLAMDLSAPEGEVTAAAGRLLRLFRKRYRDGYELIDDLQSLPSRASTVPGSIRRCVKLSKRSFNPDTLYGH